MKVDRQIFTSDRVTLNLWDIFKLLIGKTITEKWSALDIKLSLFLLLILFLSSPVIAATFVDMNGHRWTYDGKNSQEAADREKRSNPGYDVINSTNHPEHMYIGVLKDEGALKETAPRYDVPAVITSTGGIVSLVDFVKSGKFCVIYGHDWKANEIVSMTLLYCPDGCPPPDQTFRCSRCSARKTIKKTEEVIIEP